MRCETWADYEDVDEGEDELNYIDDDSLGLNRLAITPPASGHFWSSSPREVTVLAGQAIAAPLQPSQRRSAAALRASPEPTRSHDRCPVIGPIRSLFLSRWYKRGDRTIRRSP